MDIIKKFNLEPHPEGGYFREVYDSVDEVDGRKMAGSIYFLLDKEDISHFHQIDCEEIWYYHMGEGLKIYMIDPDGTYTIEELTRDNPMVVIPKGTKFAAENLDKKSYTFVSCVTCPHFMYEGFKLLTKEDIHREDIPEYLMY
ncbi:MAG: cupin domain-containing protein [Clostridia bacterium]|nr:cupin domain-containing protein [Clostridia bacterium]